MATTIALGLLCGSGIYIALGLMIGRNRYPPGAAYMAAAMLGIAVWYIGAAGEVLTSDNPTSFLVYRSIKYIGVVSVIPAFFLFVLQYATRFRGTRVMTLAVFAIPAVTLLLVWTNPLHELMWRHPPSPPGSERQPWGAWFNLVFAPYGYVLLLAALLLLARQVLRRDAVQRTQAAVLLAATLVPVAVNVAYTLNRELPDVQQTPIALGVTALIAGWGFFRFRLFQVSPIAFRKVFDSVSEAVLVADAHGVVTDMNRYAAERFRLDPDEQLGRPLGEVLRAAHLPAAAAEPDAADGRIEVAADAGTVLQVETARVADTSGRSLGRIVVVRDVTPQRRAEDALRASEEMVRSVLEQSPNGILRLRPFYSTAGRLRDFTCTLANQSAARYMGTPIETLVGARLTQLAPPHTGVLFDLFRRVLETQLSSEVELITHGAQGPVWFRVIAVPLGSDVTVTVINITALKQRELQMQAAALEDALTGLLNRRGFDTDADTLLRAQLPEEARQFALIYLDLDGFKGVNDTYGHDAGDAVLVEMARRLRASTRGNDLVARLGGDEFAVLVTDCDNATAEMMAQRIRDSSRHTFHVGDAAIALAASVGIAYGTGTDVRLGELLRQADVAMYREKRAKYREQN